MVQVMQTTMSAPAPTLVGTAAVCLPDIRGYVAAALQGMAHVLRETGRLAPEEDRAGDTSALLDLLDAEVEAAVQDVARHLCDAVGPGLHFLQPVEVCGGPEGVSVTGPSLLGSESLPAALALDQPDANDRFQAAETMARALALGRTVLQAEAILAASPDQAEVLWEWLCERGERAKTATFRVTLCRGRGVACLYDARDRQLGTWGMSDSLRVAA